ncbi:hypothetical protein M0802_016694 [Mischocyttarus mexicanus]|nr:hypothetical protein M0802_016694 [Mischocyttarus mexicanus]
MYVLCLSLDYRQHKGVTVHGRYQAGIVVYSSSCERGGRNGDGGNSGGCGDDGGGSTDGSSGGGGDDGGGSTDGSSGGGGNTGGGSGPDRD